MLIEGRLSNFLNPEDERRRDGYVAFIRLCDPGAPEDYVSHIANMASKEPNSNTWVDFLLAQPFATYVRTFVKGHPDLISKAVQIILQQQALGDKAKSIEEDTYTIPFASLNNPNSSGTSEYAQRYVRMGLSGDLIYGPDKEGARRSLVALVNEAFNPALANGAMRKISTWEGLARYHARKAAMETPQRPEGPEKSNFVVHNILNIAAILGFQQDRMPFPNTQPTAAHK